MSSVRTFVAVEIPDAVRQRIAELQERLKQHRARISWTRPGNVHLTLKFLGNVAEERLGAVMDAVERASAGIEPFRARVHQVGGFPNLRRPRVLWVGLDADPRLTRLAGEIDAALGELGFPRETRRFSPHLTIGRVKGSLSREVSEALASTSFDGGEMTVAEVVVMKSDLKPTGAVYTALRRAALRAKPEVPAE